MGFTPKPSEAIESSGGINLQDVDVRITDAAFAVFDYNGHAQPSDGNPTGAQAALKVTFRPLAATDESEDEICYLDAGWISKLAPSENGSRPGESGYAPLSSVGEEGPFLVEAEGSTATGILKSSPMMIFFQDLGKAQFPEDRIKDDIRFLIGLEGHLVRKPKMKKDNTPSLNKKGYPNTYPSISRITKFPWDKVAGKAAPAAKGAAKPAAAKATPVAKATAALSAEELAKQFLAVTIPAATGPLTPADLKRSGFGWALKQSPAPDAATRKAMCELLIDETFLLSNSVQADDASVYDFDGTALTAVAA